MPAPLHVELSMEEVLEDLSWPGPPPGRWDVPGREAAHIDGLLLDIERGAAPRPRRRPAAGRVLRS